jgi:hypothetical protein
LGATNLEGFSFQQNNFRPEINFEKSIESARGKGFRENDEIEQKYVLRYRYAESLASQGFGPAFPEIQAG